MTALAMLLGVLPMALALAEVGEQNAPPGPAIIGGLTLATFSTLFHLADRLYLPSQRSAYVIRTSGSPAKNTKGN